MIYLGAIIAVQVIILVAWLLMKKVNPQGTLLVPGLLMIALSLVLGLHALEMEENTGSVVFDLFKVVRDTFSSNLKRIGLMIMTIGGYVAYMRKIKASDALVYVAMQPLAFFRKYPYVLSLIHI